MVELLMVFAWVIPLLYLYRKAILLNHEYLADEAVVNTFNEPEIYQLLLFEKVSQSNNLVLSSPFNYLTTKKRLIMMTRKTSQKVAILKQIALIPLIVAIGFLFSTKVIAQDSPKQSVKQQQVEPSKTDAPQSVIDEYYTILAKYKIDTLAVRGNFLNTKHSFEEMRKWEILTNLDTLSKINNSDRARLEMLYFKMSKKQQKNQFVVFYPKPILQPKVIPTKEQVQLWKNQKIYGIWINGKRAKNSVLNNYSNVDFDRFETRNLDKNSVRYLNYQIEIVLMTKEYYKKYREQTIARWSKNKDRCDLVIKWSNKE
jgi:hypothetical protein